jgi:hypothetical protein
MRRTTAWAATTAPGSRNGLSRKADRARCPGRGIRHTLSGCFPRSLLYVPLVQTFYPPQCLSSPGWLAPPAMNAGWSRDLPDSMLRFFHLCLKNLQVRGLRVPKDRRHHLGCWVGQPVPDVPEPARFPRVWYLVYVRHVFLTSQSMPPLRRPGQSAELCHYGHWTPSLALTTENQRAHRS